MSVSVDATKMDTKHQHLETINFSKLLAKSQLQYFLCNFYCFRVSAASVSSQNVQHLKLKKNIEPVY